ncbi:MAG: hypothetical protein ACO3JL_09175 [Myxococcota bacterium]
MPVRVAPSSLRSPVNAVAPTAATPLDPVAGVAEGAKRTQSLDPDAFEARPGQASANAAAAPSPTPRGLPLGAWSFPADCAVAPLAATAEAPDGDALVRSLSDAVARCIASRPASDDALLADKLASFVFTDTARDFVAAVRRGERPLLSEINADPLAEAFAANGEKPVHAHMLTMNGRSSWGGVAVFCKELFPEGFYRTRALGNVAPGMLSKDSYQGEKSSLLFEQPYFRWQGDQFAFVLGDKDDNAALRLVDHLSAGREGSVTLWRGTSEAYDTPQELLTPGDGGLYAAGAMSGFGDGTASVMTTPDRKAAERWAHPTLVRFDFTAHELRQLVREGLLYAGIEYDYLELALLYDRDPESARGKGSVERMQVVETGSAPQKMQAAA